MSKRETVVMVRRKRRTKKAVSNSRPNWLSPTSINYVTTMMLQGESTLASDSSGNVLAFIPFDPSSAGYGFAEWSALASLYNEVKHVATEIQLVPFEYTGPGSPLYVSYRFDTAVAPTGVSSVVGSATMRLYNVTRDSSSKGMRSVAKSRGPLNWSPTSVVSTTAYAGAPGCYQFYGSTYTPSTSGIVLIRVRGIYAFRGRS